LKKIKGKITDLKKGNGHMLPMYQVDEIIKKYEEMIEIIKAKQEESDERMEESYQDLLNDFLQTQKKYNDLDENCSTLQERYNKLFESYNELVDLMEEPQNSEMDNKDMVLNRKKETFLNRKLNRKIKNMTKTIENMRYKNNK
jgi:superfamily I DNA and RNA helicase